ncbi:OmpA family protein [Nannocystis sp.]|uniref:OmpA family protein n=1 Tax=Nannocystis sp. TaxID=1962667 RepID=UPI00345054FD
MPRHARDAQRLRGPRRLHRRAARRADRDHRRDQGPRGSTPDKDKIRAKSRRVLDRIVAVLQRYPQVRIELAGHVDSRSVAAYTGLLSHKRADAIRDYFVDKGVDPTRIETRGADANEPLASNKSAAGRARNRRIELSLLSP